MVVSTNHFLMCTVPDKISSVDTFRLQEANCRTVPRLVSRNNQASAIPTFPVWTQVQHYYGLTYYELGRVD